MSRYLFYAWFLLCASLSVGVTGFVLWLAYRLVEWVVTK